MKNIFYVLLLTIFVTACTEQKAPPPPGTLQESKMIDVLVDIHIAEALVSSETLTKDDAKKLFKMYEDSIFNIHNISREAYYNSHDYYTHDADKFKLIYKVVVDSLTARKNTLAPPPSIDTK